MSQIIVCLKKYAKDSPMVYYFQLDFEVHTITANITHNTLYGRQGIRL